MKKLLFTILLLTSVTASAQYNGMWFEESLAQQPDVVSASDFKEKCLSNKDWCAGFIAGVVATMQEEYKMNDHSLSVEFSSAVCAPIGKKFLEDTYGRLYENTTAGGIIFRTKVPGAVYHVTGSTRGIYDCIKNGYKNAWTVR